MSKELTNKVAVVTGAASGIGRATARAFSAAGARVIVSDISESVRETAAAINDAGGVATSIVCDASGDSGVRELVNKAVALYGGLDVFHANAGITGSAPQGIFDATAQEWLDVLRVNLVGPFLAIKYAAPAMNRRGGGSIICTASVAGLRAGAAPAAYSASKAGLINLVQCACQHLAGSGIRVNAICPGLIATAMTKELYDETGMPAKELTEVIPLRRGGQPEDIAAVATFLASDAARYVNGHALVVDGGLTSSIPSPTWVKSSDVQAALGAPV